MKYKNITKQFILLFCLAMMVSCGAGAPVAPETEVPDVNAAAADEINVGGEISEVLEDISVDTEVNNDEAPMEITWGYAGSDEREYVRLPDGSEVINRLNAQFNVKLKGVVVPVDNNMFYGDWEAVSPLPDVLTVSGDADYAYGTGRFRTVPHEMIERYAPRLAAQLNANPDGWAANTPLDSANAFLGLGGYFESVPQLNRYSAYRLDWLEQAGVALPADMVEVSPGQYFTPTPFTIEKFYEAMRAFAQATAATPEHYGFVFPMTNDVRYLLDTALPNIGVMFGLNAYNMNDNGRANMYYATREYRDFLTFMADMHAQGYAAVKGTYDVEYALGSITGGNYDDGGKNDAYEVGYWNESTGRLVDDGAFYTEGRQLMAANPGAKILYAPPETWIPYERTNQTTGVYGSFDASRTNLLMVSKSVSDEKLAVILSIYDACAFDTETKVLATYGIAGANFEWAGEPYNSYMQRSEDAPTFNNSKNLLNPDVMGGPAYNPFYEANINPNNPIYLHSLTPEAAAMFVSAYKSDATGEFNDEIVAWETAHYADVRTVVTDYFYEIVLGDADVDATWEGYLGRLDAEGLQDLRAIMEKF